MELYWKNDLSGLHRSFCSRARKNPPFLNLDMSVSLMQQPTYPFMAYPHQIPKRLGKGPVLKWWGSTLKEKELASLRAIRWIGKNFGKTASRSLT